MAAAPFLPKICNAIAINSNSKPTEGDDYVPHLVYRLDREPGTSIPTAGLKNSGDAEAPSRVASNWCDGSRENPFTAIEIRLRTERKACARQRSRSINSLLCLRFTGQ